LLNLTEKRWIETCQKIKADVVIKELEGAIAELEIKQRKAITFFGKINNKDLKDNLDYNLKNLIGTIIILMTTMEEV